MSHKSTRRDFVKQSTALGVAWWVGSSASRGWAQEKSPADRLNFACIGVDGKGASDTDDSGRLANIVALCDIDDNRLNKKAARFPDAKKYNDYRKMLEEMGDQIDAVTVSTPDHSHAPAAAMAMRMGKHCFCQKPLTWSIHEARVLRELAKEKGVATQMGNQGTADTELRRAVEIVRSGDLGQIKEVHCWTNRPVWPQGEGRPTGEHEVPSYLHWDLFLGPAPERPYHPAYHPFKWRGFIDFGTGALGDMACHTMNMPVMALDLFDAKSVNAESSGIVDNESFPKWSVITYEFGQRGDFAPCKMIWYDGGKKPAEELLGGGDTKLPNTGALLIGEKGSLLSLGDYGGEKNVVLPKDKFADYKGPAESLPRSPGHFEEFVAACKGGPAAMSNFDYAGRLTETVLLGNVAMRAGEKIEWDAKNMKVINVAKANDFLGREYRSGWTL